MITKKKLITTILVFNIICLNSFAEWHEPEAKYLIKLNNLKSTTPFSIDLNEIIFPDTIENGVSLRSSSGTPLAYHRDKLTLFCENTEQQPILLYFGFKKNRPNSTWNEKINGQIPTINQLQVQMIKAWFDKTNEDALLLNSDYQKYLELKKIETQINLLECQVSQLNKLLNPRSVSQNTQEKKLKDEIKKIKNEISQKRKAYSEKEKSIGISTQIISNYRSRESCLESNFKAKKPNSDIEVIPIKSTLIEKKNVPEKRHNYACKVEGSFQIFEEGIYQFALNSTSYSSMMINNFEILNWPYHHKKNKDWSKSVAIKLFPGIHNFTFYAHIGESSDFAAAAWKKPGNTEFSTITENDLFQPEKASIKLCQDQNGNKLPIIKAKQIGRIFTDRTNFLNLIECLFEISEDESIQEWQIGKINIKKENRIQFLSQPKQNEEITVRYENKNSSAELTKIPLEKIPKSDNVIDMDVYMNIKYPEFIFDDEILEMILSIYSLIPNDMIVELKTSSFPKDEIFPKLSEYLILPAKQTEEQPFTPPEIIRKNFKLDGRKLSQKTTIARVSISIPPLELQDQTIIFAPLSSLSEIQCENGLFLHDNKGRKIVPIIHRPNLSEKRAWSFADSITDELINSPKTIIIADNFGPETNSFSAKIAKAIGKKTHIDFISWDRIENNSTMLYNLPKIIQTIKNSDARRLIIIPSSLDTENGISAQLQSRIICAILQTARENKKIKQFILTTPIPSIKINEIENDLLKTIKTTIKTDFAVDKIIDINSFVKSQHNWISYYREALNSPAILTLHPVHMGDQIARFIADSL